METGTANADLEHVLAVHPSDRVRGAMHRSFAIIGEHSLCLAANLGIAKELVRRSRPAAVVLRLEAEHVDWAAELTASWIAPVVFCFHRDDELALASRARRLGMTHFVELPDDRAASWAKNAKRLSGTILNATRGRSAPKKIFARTTVVQPVVTLDIARTLQVSEPQVQSKALALDTTQTISAVRLADLRQAQAASPEFRSVLSNRDAAVDVIAIGSSTGGTDALAQVLPRMPLGSPCIVVVQHILAGTEMALARRLNEQCSIEVRVAEDGDELRQGLALLAPSGRHLQIVNSGRRAMCRLSEDEGGDSHRPSVNVLFRSVAQFAGRAIGVILSGMGSDGAQGMTVLRRAGCLTIAQDKASSVAYGMPSAAISTGSVAEVIALGDLAERLCRQAKLEPLASRAAEESQKKASKAKRKSRRRRRRGAKLSQTTEMQSKKA